MILAISHSKLLISKRVSKACVACKAQFTCPVPDMKLPTLAYSISILDCLSC